MFPQTAPEPRKNVFQKITQFLSLEKNVTALLLMVILIGIGEWMADRFMPLYIQALGGSLEIIGVLSGMKNLMGALYSFPAAYLSERLGYKRSLIVFNIIALVGYSIVIVFQSWAAVLVGAFFYLAWSSVSLPATMSLISSNLPNQKRTMGVSMVSITKRLPKALGPIIGGALIGAYGQLKGIRYAFMVAFVFGMIALVVQQIMIKEEPAKSNGTPLSNPFAMFKFITPDLRNLLISDTIIRFCEQIPDMLVVMWVVELNHISELEFGFLSAVEMATAMLVYIPVAYLADRSSKKPFVLMTFGFFTLFPLVLLFSHNLPMLILAFIVRGLKEFGEPTRKALILDLAPEDHKAAVFGVYYLIRDSIVSLAAFGGVFLWAIRPEINLLAAFGFGVVGTIYFALFGRDLGPAKIREGA
ncbi:MAG TPA: MFS transporter [Anaerolineaceae bacterium]|jgi:MFS family permease|nr:MFS transporter [Anaerolineaceae bacterium]